MIGKLHSFESCGTVDGPGLRYVVFMQGCPLRCKFCHNPDSWNINEAKTETTPEDLLKQIKKYENFFKKSGGVTFTGGEPLLQAKFIADILKLCKAEGYHTAIDTSGYMFNDDVKHALQYADLVLLDIKSIDPSTYQELVGVPLENTLKFAEYLSEQGIKTWIRHVLVPEWTDKDEDLEKLATFVSSLKTVDKVEILPYHKMGEYKWDLIGKEYPLKGLEPPTKDRVENAKAIFERKGLSVH